jgi:hypothetical protein
MGRGIDYGMGATNIDKDNGIRYGVIPQNAVLQAWADSSESDYGQPHCPKCGNEAQEASQIPLVDDNGDELELTNEDGQEPEWFDRHLPHHCADCCYSFDNDHAYGDEPLGYYLDDGEHQATCGSDGDIFITKSPYYTRAAFCSPCAPGACYLMSPCEDGEKAYCFGHDWFDGNKAPYPVYRVADDTLVQPS